MNPAIAKQIIEDKLNGMPDNIIGNKYNVNLKFIEKVITEHTGVNISNPSLKKTGSKNLLPKDFELEKSTVWSFKSRGSWATHNGNYRGNWSPYIPR
ncbi:MAG: site-specific DNA-methyltransferase, partial [Actinobacteria bacterium]|nr:site-specific DNA-methyltransferase [Actinomycetota bacterium]